MDATQMDAEHVITGYLSGALPDGESDAFEQYVSEHPEICPQIEQTLKLREGLARLRERGELDALLRTPAPRRWLPYAAAAAVAFATVAGLLWLQLRGPAAAMLFLSPGELAAHYHQAVAVRASYVLARTRGTARVTEVTLPTEAGAIELKAVPSGASNIRYRVGLWRLAGPAGTADTAQLDAGAAGPDGYVTVYVDSSQLMPGDYAVSLTPAVSGGAGAAADRFVIRVRSP
jgi:hypothetical protein